MYRSLYFKIILIMVVFVIAAMCVVGIILLNSIMNYYTDQFYRQMDDILAEDKQLSINISETMSDDGKAKEEVSAELSAIIPSWFSKMGIDDYRTLYVLSSYGEVIYCSSGSSEKPAVTPNLLAAMSSSEGNKHDKGAEYVDYAVLVEGSASECIVYVIDTQEEVKEINWILFSIIVQAVLIGFVIAVILAFVLSKAIAAPIQQLNRGVTTIASGDFSQKLEVSSRDELGTLTYNFNKMSTVLKNTLDEVQSERGKLQTVFSCLKDGVIAFSEDGKVININESAIALFADKYNESFSFKTLINMLVDTEAKLPEDDFGAPDIDTSEILHNIVFRDKVFEVSFGKITYANEAGSRKEGVISVIHDITERYALDTAQREFVANVSHELRTPLTSIKGACEAILEHPDMPEELQKNFLGMAVTESDRMTRIVQDLLILSRLDNNRTRWEISEYNINDSLSYICNALHSEATSRGHALVFDEDKEAGSLTADREKIEQVIINVVSNSLKYTQNGGLVRVSAHGDEEFVTVTVKDNGIGIPEEDVAHIFERFYRVEKSRTAETGGTGLGLAIAKDITVAHGGDISISSKPGRGTTVTIVLPRECKLALHTENK